MSHTWFGVYDTPPNIPVHKRQLVLSEIIQKESTHDFSLVSHQLILW